MYQHNSWTRHKVGWTLGFIHCESFCVIKGICAHTLSSRSNASSQNLALRCIGMTVYESVLWGEGSTLGYKPCQIKNNPDKRVRERCFKWRSTT